MIELLVAVLLLAAAYPMQRYYNRWSHRRVLTRIAERERALGIDNASLFEPLSIEEPGSMWREPARWVRPRREVSVHEYFTASAEERREMTPSMH